MGCSDTMVLIQNNNTTACSIILLPAFCFFLFMFLNLLSPNCLSRLSSTWHSVSVSLWRRKVFCKCNNSMCMSVCVDCNWPVVLHCQNSQCSPLSSIIQNIVKFILRQWQFSIPWRQPGCDFKTTLKGLSLFPDIQLQAQHCFLFFF